MRTGTEAPHMSLVENAGTSEQDANGKMRRSKRTFRKLSVYSSNQGCNAYVPAGGHRGQACGACKEKGEQAMNAGAEIKKKMDDSKKLRTLSDMIFNLSIDQERAAVIADEIDQNYFELDDDSYKILSFEKTGIEFDILEDYIIRMGDALDEINKMLCAWRLQCDEKGGAA